MGRRQGIALKASDLYEADDQEAVAEDRRAGRRYDVGTHYPTCTTALFSDCILYALGSYRQREWWQELGLQALRRSGVTAIVCGSKNK